MRASIGSDAQAEEDDLDPAAFLKSVRELSEKREREDNERYRKLEEEIEKGRQERLARRAGALILDGSAAIQSASYESEVGEKKNSVDLVTEYDVKVEKLVQDELKAQFPTFSL